MKEKFKKKLSVTKKRLTVDSRELFILKLHHMYKSLIDRIRFRKR